MGTASDLPHTVRLPVLSEEWHVRYVRGGRDMAAVSAGVLVVRTKCRDPRAAREALLRWLRRRARERLAPVLLELARTTGLPCPARVRVGLQRSRWASCSGRGTVSLNARTLFLPADLARHVLVHELCHLVHLDHSPRFYALLAEHEAEHEAVRRRMRTALSWVPGWAGGGPSSPDAD